jgi:hypothetical protein
VSGKRKTNWHLVVAFVVLYSCLSWIAGSAIEHPIECGVVRGVMLFGMQMLATAIGWTRASEELFG